MNASAASSPLDLYVRNVERLPAMHIRFLKSIFGFSLLWLVACAAPPTKVPPSPTARTVITPTGTRVPMRLGLTIVDPGLAYGDPCKAPCWYDLIPGKTTLQEYLQALPRLNWQICVDLNHWRGSPKRT